MTSITPVVTLAVQQRIAALIAHSRMAEPRPQWLDDWHPLDVLDDQGMRVYLASDAERTAYDARQ